MATTSEPHEEPEQTYVFAPKLHPRWALRKGHLVAVAGFAVLFLLLGYLPLRATDIWGHVAYGHWILEHRQLPTADLWMPLAQGMQVIDTAWLAQVVLALIERFGGPHGLSLAFAIVGVATYLLLARAYFHASRHLLAALATTFLVFIVAWSRIGTIRPESLAVLCFAGLICLAAGQQRRWREAADDTFRVAPWLWVAVPLLFVLWANLHGSFVCGLAVLGCLAAGRLLDAGWETRRLGAALADRRFRGWLFLFELSLVATLVNPYGVDLWIHTLLFAKNPNLATVLEWQPLVVFGIGGREFALSIVVLLALFRWSRERVSLADVLLLGLFAFATLQGVRMIGWYAMVFGLAIAPHLGALFERWLPAPHDDWSRCQPDEHGRFELPPGRSWRLSLGALLILWIVFALAPMSGPVFGRRPRTPEQLYGPSTPVALTAHLRESPPAGQTFHPQWWGDWLMHDGPPGLVPFVTTNLHLAPPQVWRDYGRILAMQAGWERALDRYNVNTIIVDREQQNSLFRALRRNTEWSLTYEDPQAAVFRRVAPPGGRRQPESELAWSATP